LPNDLIKKEIRQECPALPGISFFSRAAPQVAISEILARPQFYLLLFCQMQQGGPKKSRMETTITMPVIDRAYF
jgi:hypothetical protein